MSKRIRFFYRLTIAILKKEWKRTTFIFSLILLLVGSLTILVPNISSKFAGSSEFIKPVYIEAVVGKPTTFNPLFSTTEVEKEINSLVFRGLVKIGLEGKLEMDLADRYEVRSDTEYTFYLKQNIKWHDGKEFTADDVVYTIQTSQNPLYDSQVQESFQDVEVIKKNNYTVIFRLKEPFSPFASALSLGIIPEHIKLTDYRPVGTGSYRFTDIKEDSAILESSKLKIIFRYYPTLAQAETAVKLGEVHGLPGYGSNGDSLSNWENFQINIQYLPYRLVLAFFNNKDPFFADKQNGKQVRQALSHATPKGEIIKNSIGDKGVVAFNSLPNIKTFQNDSKEKYNFDLEKASALLSEAGWELKDGFRYKDGVQLKITITTVADPEFEDTALKIRAAWAKIGVEVSVLLVSGIEMQDTIVPNRDFQILLTSQILSPDPDQYVLWHTTQGENANISAVASPKIDKLLEDGRRTSDLKIRTEKYQEFTRIILDEAPAIFLYYPRYVWLVSKRIEKIDLSNFHFPEDRFKSSDNWVIKSPLF